MLKKLFSLIVTVLISVTVFTGCNLTNINNAKFNLQTVAEVVYEDSVRTFSLKDLWYAYQSYGYQYAQNGLSAEDTVRKTLDTMVDRGILVDIIRDEISLEDEEEQLMKDVYSNINKNLAEFEKQILEDWNLTVEDATETQSETQNLRPLYEPYKPTVILNDNNILERVTEEKIIDNSEAGEFVQDITDEKVSAEAWKRYISQLRSSSEAEGIINKTDEQLFNLEIERIYKIIEENRIITKYQEQYLASLEINTNAVVKRYQELVLRDYYKYSNNINAYHTDMRSDAFNGNKIYYHPVSNAYLNVSHILIKLTDEQNEKIAEIQHLKVSNPNSYNYQLNKILQKTEVVYDGGKISAYQLQDYIARELDIAGNKNLDSGLIKRAEKFNEFMYLYSDDSAQGGIFNSDYSYVVNLTNVAGQKNIMIDEFTSAAQNLHKNEGAGSISNLVFAEYETGKFGFHIIMDLGVIENYIPFNLVNAGNVSWESLYNKRTQLGIEKSLFNLIYDDLKLESAMQEKSNERISQVVAQVKQDVRVKYYEGAYKNFLR